MKLWIDDVRPAPIGYYWCKTVNQAMRFIEGQEQVCATYPPGKAGCLEIELIDLDHDAGNYAQYGGDYIKLLDWLEETGRNYPIRIHSQNPVGIQNMRAIIERNGWTEVR
jgi:hypothetical protein